jgi:hypothetical protein
MQARKILSPPHPCFDSAPRLSSATAMLLHDAAPSPRLDSAQLYGSAR